MRKYAIIGASGLIGSHLTRKLVESASVYAFSRSPLPFTHSNLNWVKCDLQRNTIVNQIPKDTQTIIYLAQSEYFRDFPSKALEIFNVNVNRYLEVLEYATKNNIAHVMYASSGGVYAQQNRQFAEEDKLALSEELGFYLGSKICAETISSSFSTILNLQVIRFFFVYGQGQKENMLIPRLIKSIKEEKSIQLEGENGVTINPVYVDDAVSAITLLLNLHKSEIYNVGGDIDYSLREICVTIGNVLGITPRFEVKNGHEKKICGNTKKIKNSGWIPKVSLEEGLRNVIEDKQ